MGATKKYNWLKPDFYPQAYDRFNRLRWGLDPIKLKYHVNLDPSEYHLSDDERSRIPLHPFSSPNVQLSLDSLVGQINGFNNDLASIRIWQAVLLNYNQIQRIHLMDEFVEPLLSSCLFAPYALKNQMTFTGTKIAILFEKGQIRPKLPEDDRISFKDFQQWAGHWRNFNRVAESFKKLSDFGFIQKTDNFRHRYNHRIPPRIGFGVSARFKFEREGKSLKVYFSSELPLRLSKSVNAAILQHRACVSAFKAFWKMIRLKLYD